MRRGLLVIAALGLWPPGSDAAEEPAPPLEIESETAGICGFRPLWDRPVPLAEDGAVAMVRSPYGYGDALDALWLEDKRKNGTVPGGLGFDAVHRAMLVRFPTAARLIAGRMNLGYTIARIELDLPFRATELWPEYYLEPGGLSFIGRAWIDQPPRWHAIGWVLRRPWASDPERGPTYNANINGISYWTKFGAQDIATDRYPTQFGPAEVSSAQPDGRIDLTAVARDPSYGETLADRLAVLNDQGILVRKWELYDASYWNGGYEFATGTGHRAILIRRPRLIVTFSPASLRSRLEPLPPFDLAAAVARTREAGTGGRPTAVLPSSAQIREFAGRLGFVQPEWMPDWQWKRVRELHALGGGFVFPDGAEAYGKWMDNMLGIEPRRWSGFDAPEALALYRRYEEAWPQPVRDHWKLYWNSWLQPDRPYSALVHGYIGAAQARAYYDATRDWRGNFSVYRTYCRSMGPMDFNHWAVAGALIGGGIVGSDYAMDDGHHGLAVFPLRTWSWADGSTQESIDHYYFSITLASQKVFADYGPTAYDRVIGKAILTKSVEELASCFHPGLRRFIATSGRTGVAYVLGEQDGLQHIMHVLSPAGALTDAGSSRVGGIDVIGHDLLPGQVAELSLSGPWAPDWIPDLIEHKPIPYRFLTHGGGQWHQSYLGANYGLASRETSIAFSTVPLLAQWRRSAEPVRSMTELGTLLVRYGINRTEFLDSIYHGTGQHNPNGIVGDQGGHLFILQEKNKLIALSSPVRGLDAGRPVPKSITSLQMTIGFYRFAPALDWEVYVDEQRVNTLPARARVMQRITIKDGVTYLGILPLPATDLGRTREVVLSAGGKMTEMQGGGEAAEAMRIDAYNYDNPSAVEASQLDTEAVDAAWAGYVIEISDQSEFQDFAAFQRHFAAAKAHAEVDPDSTKLVRVGFESGGDRLEVGFNPLRDTSIEGAISYRSVNGHSPFPPDGIVREGPLTEQGTTGRLDKNGASLLSAPGVMSYLATEPVSGTVAAFNIPPEDKLNPFQLTIPGGVSVTANGALGLAYVAVRPKDRRVWIEQGYNRVQSRDPARAQSVTIGGLSSAPQVELNGIVLPMSDLRPAIAFGRPAWTAPLAPSQDGVR
jgi:hypothetical protein